MYCLTLVVTDYPAKLSHEALPSQQVMAGTGHMFNMMCPCVVFI
jgi:hypothetical protein